MNFNHELNQLLKEKRFSAFRMNPLHLEKWIHQNQAEYTGCWKDGVLIDSFVLSCKRGYAFCYETYVNPNQSEYTICFCPYKRLDAREKIADLLWAGWYDFCADLEG